MSKANWIYKLIKRYSLEAEIMDKILRDNPEFDTNPVNKIHELDDRPDKCFVWDTDMTDQQIIEFTSKIRTEFVKKYNHDPKALHLIRNDLNDITELDPEVVKQKVEPWLNSSD